MYRALPFVILAALSGCGRSDRVAVYPVEGKLTMNGQPLAGAQVVFHPQTRDKVLPARGTTDSRGNFRLTTYDAQDGAAAGTYSITVAHYPLVQWQGEFLPGGNILPPKYAALATTDLKAEVAQGNNRVETLDLKR
jgi:hypothetical protein